MIMQMKALPVVAALCALLLWPHADAFCQKPRAAGPVLVRAQVKPDKPWKEYPSRTVYQLPDFPLAGTDRNVDEYGGRGDSTVESKGFFRIQKIGDRWWFIDPSGALYYNRSVVSVNTGKSRTSAQVVKSVFGDGLEWANRTVRMLKENGFNGTGAWTDETVTQQATPRLPYTIVWNFMSGYGSRRGGTYQQAGHTGYPEDCIFVFDPEFESFCDERASRLDELKDDPYLLGHFSDNELPFPEDALDRFLKLSRREPGFKAADEWLGARKPGNSGADQITPEDRAAFLGVVADRYFEITSRAIRKHDPNHLVLGARFHGGTLKREPVFRAAGKYLDVVSINYYNAWTPDSARMEEWVAWSGRPILITEWYVKGADAGLPNESGAGWIVPTQSDRGVFYQHFALGLLEFKGCVGWQWFKYIDNDPQATDVDPSNSDANKGIVNIRFEPYSPLLDKMKELNTRVYRLIDYFDGPRTR